MTLFVSCWVSPHWRCWLEEGVQSCCMEWLHADLISPFLLIPDPSSMLHNADPSVPQPSNPSFPPIPKSIFTLIPIPLLSQYLIPLFLTTSPSQHLISLFYPAPNPSLTPPSTPDPTLSPEPQSLFSSHPLASLFLPTLDLPTPHRI